MFHPTKTPESRGGLLHRFMSCWVPSCSIGASPESKRRFGLFGEYGQLLTGWEQEYDHGSRTLSVTRLAPGSYELDTATGIYPTDLTARMRFTVTDRNIEGMVLT